MHAQTPHLTVVDPRGLAVRVLDYHRDTPGAQAQLRVRHARFDARGRQVELRDPRLWCVPQAPANLTNVHSLSGQVLASEGVDNGLGCSLPNEAGRVVRQWDGRGSQRTLVYDELLRPVAVFEQLAGRPSLCSERHTYADGSAEHAAHNRCARLLRHDDPAGTRDCSGFSLTGEASRERRRFLASGDWPDWPQDADARDALLEPGEGAVTTWRHGPLGQVLEQTDAGGHRQFFGSNLSGELSQVRLQLADRAPLTLLDSARYDARGRMRIEVHGNGLTSLKTYGEADGRLLSLVTRRDTGQTLQDIHYGYDPAGNLISLQDLAQPVRHFANQRIEPRCEYRYDSLYQLIEATGWESGAVSRGPGTLTDAGAVSNYRQTYRYDAAGNLLDLTHVGAQSHGRILSAARHSNRCLEHIGGPPPGDDDFLDRFDANGNLLELLAGRRLHWDVRNQLGEASPVTRTGKADDVERYVYDAAGQRLRKWRSVQAAGRSLHSEVRYLPGLELHDNPASGEQLQVITVQAGTCGVRVLRWLAGRPDDVAQDQLRYGLADHLGSGSLELDQAASLISHEVFHPFGSTAWWAARSDIEAGYKTIRYSGKERDATGLYYYGARYYVPWLQRWLNPDPAGAVDGLNLYCMVNNSPLRYRDADGRQGFDVLDAGETEALSQGKLLASGLGTFSPEHQKRVRDATKLASRSVDKALLALEGGKGQKRLENILLATFGRESSPATDSDGISLQQRLKAVRPYVASLGKEEGWRLMLVTTWAGVRGYVSNRSVTEGRTRIAIGQALLDQPDDAQVASVLLHESFHAVGFAEPNSSNWVLDMWYTMPIEGVFSQESLHENSRKVMREGPDLRSMIGAERVMFYNIVGQEMLRLGKWKEGVRPGDFAWRTDAFTENVSIRFISGLRNADTLTGIAMAFYKPRSRMSVALPRLKWRV